MAKVFFSQKTEQRIKKLELTQWRKNLQEKIEERELKNMDELTPEARLLGYNFSVVIQNDNNDVAIEIIEKIEKLPTIWRN